MFTRRIAIRSSHSGFTLVELAVVVAIIAVLVGIAIPSMNRMTQQNRLVSAANEMMGVLQLARMEAISSRTNVDVCPTSNGTSCSNTLGNRWMASRTRGGTTTVLRDVIFSNSTVVAGGNLQTGTYKFTFRSDGMARSGNEDKASVSFCAPKLSGDNAIDVTVSFGRINSLRRSASAACTAPNDKDAKQ